MTPTELHKATGISVPYASQLLTGIRTPSFKMAVRIYEATGVQLGFLKGMTEKEIAPLVRTRVAA